MPLPQGRELGVQGTSQQSPSGPLLSPAEGTQETELLMGAAGTPLCTIRGCFWGGGSRSSGLGVFTQVPTRPLQAQDETQGTEQAEDGPPLSSTVL